MKKIFTLASMALVAMSMNAQVEVWDASKIKDESKFAEDPLKTEGKYNIVIASEVTIEDVESENVIIHDDSDVLPWPGMVDANGNKITDPEEWKKISPEDQKNYTQLETDINTITNTSTRKLQKYVIKASTNSVDVQYEVTPNNNDSSPGFGFGLAVDPRPRDVYKEGEEGAYDPYDLDKHANNKSLITDKFSTKFLDYIKGSSGNAFLKHVEWSEYNTDGEPTPRTKDVEWTLEETKAPAIGPIITLTAQCDGRINIGVFVNKNIQSNPVYVLDVNEDETYTALAPSELTYSGYINNCTADHFEGNAADNYVVTTDTSLSNPFLGYLSFDMKAGKKYMIFIAKNLIGLYGFEFTPKGGADGITEIATTASDNAPVYNLAGQRVSNDTKGLLIKNGKKFINK